MVVGLLETVGRWLTGDGSRQVRGVDVEKRRGAMMDPYETLFLRRRNLLPFAVSGGKGEAAITSKFHDKANHAPAK